MASRNSGSVLPFALFFASIVGALVFGFAFAQRTLFAPANHAYETTQARINATSGIWKMVADVTGGSAPPETLVAINTLDSMFMFRSPSQSPLPAIEAGGSLFSDQMRLDSLYSSTGELSSESTFGACSTKATFTGCFLSIDAHGFFRNQNVDMRARMVGRIANPRDTVAFLRKGAPVIGGFLLGKSAAGIGFEKRDSLCGLNTEMRSKIIASYKEVLVDTSADSTIIKPPLLIGRNDQCAGIPDVVPGPLFFDGTRAKISFKSNRKIVVMGDLQLTGTVELVNVSFVVKGEVRIYDDGVLNAISVYAGKRFVMLDRARCSGSVLVCGAVILQHNSELFNKAVIVSLSENIVDTTGEKSAAALCAVRVLDNVRVDGTLVACGADNAKILISQQSKVTGIVWASKGVCIIGSVEGLVYADCLFDIDNPPKSDENSLRGKLRMCDRINWYRLPVFIGMPFVDQWFSPFGESR